MTGPSPTDILVRGTRELARMGDLRRFLDSILSGLAAATGAGSGAILFATADLAAVAIDRDRTR